MKDFLDETIGAFVLIGSILLMLIPPSLLFSLFLFGPDQPRPVVIETVDTTYNLDFVRYYDTTYTPATLVGDTVKVKGGTR